MMMIMMIMMIMIMMMITTRDFLLPSNLLANMKTSDRIYGFYYIVA